jgi:hypothetical protein
LMYKDVDSKAASIPLVQSMTIATSVKYEVYYDLHAWYPNRKAELHLDNMNIAAQAGDQDTFNQDEDKLNG